MNNLRRIPITIAVISAIVTVASSRTLASDLIILEATPQKLVVPIPASGGQEKLGQHLEEAKQLAAEHCKKFGKVAGTGNLSMNIGSSSMSAVATFQCRG